MEALRTKSTGSLILPVLCMVFTVPCPATMVPRLSLEELTDGSQLIIHGHVRRSWTAWDRTHQFIWTHYEVQVLESLKGIPQSRVVVSEPGGAVGGMVMRIGGTLPFTIGEEAILFLYRTPVGYWRTYGLGQGKYTVTRDPVSGRKVIRTNLQGMTLVDLKVSRESRPLSRATSLSSLSGLKLEAFRAQIRTALGRKDAKAAAL